MDAVTVLQHDATRMLYGVHHRLSCECVLQNMEQSEQAFLVPDGTMVVPMQPKQDIKGMVGACCCKHNVGASYYTVLF
jgi:hypothetical protein